MNALIVFSEFLPEDQFVTTAGELTNTCFAFGAISTNPELPIWQGEVEKQSSAVQRAMDSLHEKSGARFDLVSCHINLQTHGLDGAFHRDNNDPNGQVTHALNWYVHPYEWPAEFGGYLLVDDGAQHLRAILPARNTAVLIPAEALHCATSPFLKAGAVARMSLTLKLRLRNAF